jgi:chromosomal replication initiation ATPase DnaA
MSRQPPLDLGLVRRRAFGREDFVVTRANADAVALIDARDRWPQRRLGLSGPEGAGKTHLAHVFAAATGAAIVAAAGLRPEHAPALAARGAVAVEDVDRLADAADPGAAETALFHLMNLTAAEGAALLVTGRAAPAHWRVGLPDLASRLAALTPATLSPPDDALLAAVIARDFAERGLVVEPGVPAFLAARIERSFAAAEAAVEALDRAALAARRPVTRKLAAALLAPRDGLSAPDDGR